MAKIDYRRDLDILSSSVVVPDQAAMEILSFTSEQGYHDNLKRLGLRRVRLGERRHGITAGNLRDAIRLAGLTT